jgi:hypothetical protein
VLRDPIWVIQTAYGLRAFSLIRKIKFKAVCERRDKGDAVKKWFWVVMCIMAAYNGLQQLEVAWGKIEGNPLARRRDGRREFRDISLSAVVSR